MRSRYKFVESQGVYFVTSTVIEWIPVLIGARCDILIECLAYCRLEKGLRVYAFVVMENHLHLVCEAPDLSRTIQSFKRHTAKRIIQHAKDARQEWLLNQLAYNKKGYKTGSSYQVWQEGVHPQLLQSDAMLRQKVEYIHHNPVRRGYVDLPEHWRYSSARNYVKEGVPVMEIDEIPIPR